MIDDITGRKVVIGFSITTSASTAGERPRVCAGTVQAATSATGVSISVTEGSTSGCSTSTNADCTLVALITYTFDPSYCAGSGLFSDNTLVVSYDLCDDAAATNSVGSESSDPLSLQTRNVCSTSQASVSTSIVPKNVYGTYFIGDVVTFPFTVQYTGLSISKVTFNSIGVTAGSSSPVYLFDSLTYAPTASGSAVQLHTETLSQLNSGTGTIWFSIKLTREAGSPFVSLDPNTDYAFDVVFDVVYKNAKRNLEGREVEVGKQISSRAYIRVSDQAPSSEPSEVIESLSLLASSAYTVQVGLVVVLFSIILALF